MLNEYGDHWGQEFAHRIGKHDLCLDILPPGYVLKTRRDEQGQLVRQLEDDDAAFFLSAWLRCLVFNLTDDLLCTGYGRRVYQDVGRHVVTQVHPATGNSVFGWQRATRRL